MLVLRGAGFVFSTRTMQGVYPDANAILSQIKPMYDAIADAGVFRSCVSCADTVYEPGKFMRLALREGGIEMSCESSTGKFSTTADAVVLNDMPGEGFHYNAEELRQSLRNLDGNLQIGIDRTGNMLLKGQNLCYLLTPRRPRKVDAAAKPKKTKKAAKAPKADKAA
jgi:hypothetical protein